MFKRMSYHPVDVAASREMNGMIGLVGSMLMSHVALPPLLYGESLGLMHCCAGSCPGGTNTP